MDTPDTRQRFEETILPHLSAAYDLARWLVRGGPDAEDIVQESYLRAFRSFDTFRGGNGRAWLLAIVRNTSFSWLDRNRRKEATMSFDETIHRSGDVPDPEAIVLAAIDRERLREALEDLPPEYREVIVLRELEGLSYKEIAGVARIPIGTVMSRLARARKRMIEFLGSAQSGVPSHAV